MQLLFVESAVARMYFDVKCSIVVIHVFLYHQCYMYVYLVLVIHYLQDYFTYIKTSGGCTGLVVRASDSGSGDPGSILGRVGVLFP